MNDRGDTKRRSRGGVVGPHDKRVRVEQRTRDLAKRINRSLSSARVDGDNSSLAVLLVLLLGGEDDAPQARQSGMLSRKIGLMGETCCHCAGNVILVDRNC